jgi:glycosyltransferase involved in cell wall biosynthesis
MKVLFVLKKNSYGYSGSYGYGVSGLLSSARFVADMLNHSGVRTEVKVVTDNNDIDREVTKYRPDIVIIEALWVVPEKFDVLKSLHPTVTWVVRVHSDFPFLATEGVAMQWLFGYLNRGVNVAFNSYNTACSFWNIYESPGVLYLPNYYPKREPVHHHSCEDRLNVGCFGAIRPLKNQLTQAVAAILYADSVGKTLSFYVNATRCEQGGEDVLKNLRALFANTGHNLIESEWKDHHEFLGLLSCMDLVMCVSFTETFCIVAADSVSVGTPLLCSKQIPWASLVSTVSETDVEEIAKHIGKILRNPWLYNALNRRNLRKYSEKSKETWLKVLKGDS